ncbi:Pollen receptor-like kinase 1 [Forsythia ovata]|uniref:non-specific serine/threonine protein kinase n=1 Tax=Forsythia ovata TaxID=205694 RepID=A0ABD1QSJ9_9LAMI
MPMGTQAAHPLCLPIPPTTFVISLLLLLLVFLPTLSMGDDQGDANKALLNFKGSLANTEEALANWNSSISPCNGNYGNWNGVLCFNGYVWGLQLEKMNLRGQIDVDSLIPLRALRTLSFMSNSFEGQMPDWRKLGALKSLFLSNNQFSGQIPDDAFNGMTSLKKVFMANNKFTGKIPTSLAKSPRLIELRLDNNQFTGPIPEFRPDNLKQLNVSNNQLEGPIPAVVSNLDPSSFSGNRGLCGKPLEKACNVPFPDDGDDELDPPIPTPLHPTSNPPAKKSPAASMAITVIAIIVGLLFILILVLLYRRSHQRETPQLGRAYNENNSAETAANTEINNVKVESVPAPDQINGNSRKADQPGKLSFVREERRKFDLQDLLRASAEVLGSGKFGASYKAVLVDGDALVVKRFKQMNNVGREDFHEHMRRLGRLDHPNLLPLVAYLYRKEEKLLVFDYAYSGSLASHLHGKHSAEHPGLDWSTRLKIIKGVANGLAYLHSELPSLSVPHGHLKSSNVLLDKNFEPLLMDYTLEPVMNSGQIQQILVAYKSPEYAQHGQSTKKTDVWCLGVLILETLTGKFVAKYLSHHGTGYDADLAGWINAIVSELENNEQVFDHEMGNTEECREEMEKLLHIGIACCQEDMEKRWDLEEVVDKIQQLKQTY